jgi:hypothetical protein
LATIFQNIYKPSLTGISLNPSLCQPPQHCALPSQPSKGGSIQNTGEPEKVEELFGVEGAGADLVARDAYFQANLEGVQQGKQKTPAKQAK